MDLTMDYERFLSALIDMSVMLKDELSKDRIRLYWQSFQGTVSIEEWEYAAAYAIDHATFHAIPLPSVLQDYVQGYREQRNSPAIPRSSDTGEVQSESVEEKEQQALAQRAAMLADEEAREVVAQVLARLPDPPARGPAPPLGASAVLNPPDPTRWLPLTDDFSPERRATTRAGRRGLLRLVERAEGKDAS
jgi:hypothetical protein